MFAVPAAIPVTRPEPVTTVATDGALLLQVPPPVALLSVAVCPIHTVSRPVFDGNSLFTVTTVVLVQLLPTV